MEFLNPLSREELGNVIADGFTKPIETNNKKRIKVIRELEEIARSNKLCEKDLSPIYSRWSTFYTIVNKVGGYSHEKEVNDYCLFHYSQKDDILYIAQEPFVDLEASSLSEFLFANLNTRFSQDYIDEVLRQRQQERKMKYEITLDDYQRELLMRRVVPYSAKLLIDAMMDKAFTINESKDKDEEMDWVYGMDNYKRMSEGIAKLLDSNQPGLEGLRAFFKKRKSLKFSLILKETGKIRVWSANYYATIRALEGNLEKGDLPESYINLLDLNLMETYMNPYDIFDVHLQEHAEEGKSEFEEFLDQVMSHTKESFKRFGLSTSKKDRESIIVDLKEINKEFPDFKVSVHKRAEQFHRDLTRRIVEMEQVLV